MSGRLARLPARRRARFWPMLGLSVLLLNPLFSARAFAIDEDVAMMYAAADARDAGAKVWAGVLNGSDEGKREDALRLLGRIGGDAVVPLIAAHLEENEVSLRRTAAFALGISDSKLAVDPVLKALAAEPAPAVRNTLWLALANLAPEGIQEKIIAEWDKDEARRPALAQATAFLWALRRDRLSAIDAGLAQRLLDATDGPGPVAGASAAALARIRREKAADGNPLLGSDATVAALTSAQDEQARQFLIRVLGVVADEAGEKVLFSWLHGGTAVGRKAGLSEIIEAAGALAGRQRGEALAATLKTALAHGDWRVRTSALQALATRPDAVNDVRAQLEAHQQKNKDDAYTLQALLNPPLNADEDKPEPAKAPVPLSTALQAVHRVYNINTNRGNILIRLMPDAPYTAWNFAELADRGYYDKTIFHRVIPHFVAQGGDPTGTGSGGPGWRIREELSMLPHAPGTLGMATAGKDTGGSQFFFNSVRNWHLDWHYTVFAVIESGEEVAQQLRPGDQIISVKLQK